MPATAARFYVDEDTLPLGKALAAVRDDVVHPGHRRCSIPIGAKDPDWLPTVGQAGWLLISRDKRIRARPALRIAMIEHGVRAVFLTKSGNMNRWEQLQLVVQHWARIEALTELDGPFAYSVTTRGVSAQPLRDPRLDRSPP